jgi:hypothetical protein
MNIGPFEVLVPLAAIAVIIGVFFLVKRLAGDRKP